MYEADVDRFIETLRQAVHDLRKRKEKQSKKTTQHSSAVAASPMQASSSAAPQSFPSICSTATDPEAVLNLLPLKRTSVNIL